MQANILMLSGGRSSRMGMDKAALKIQGESLLQWQVNRFQQAGYTVIYGVPDLRSGFLGPLAGIESALKAEASASSWLVLPVDMPYFSIQAAVRLIDEGVGLIEKGVGLIEKGAENSSLCSYQNYPLPLFLNHSQQVLSVLTDWLDDETGPRSVRQLIRHFKGHEIPASQQPNEFKNLNTPEQWQAFIAGESMHESCSKRV